MNLNENTLSYNLSNRQDGHLISDASSLTILVFVIQSFAFDYPPLKL
nr:MAG TPA: hypothetical protein [Caudoviricetes sp.]